MIKKTILSIILIVGCVGFSTAQVTLGSFENNGINPVFNIEESSLTSLQIANNPKKSLLNNTDLVLYAKTTNNDAPWWAGVKINFHQAITINTNTRYLHVLIKTDIPKYEFVLFNNNNSDEKWIGQYSPTTSEWFDYVVDLNSITGLNFSSIRIAMHLDDQAQRNKELWIDEIILNDDSSPRTLPGSYVHDVSINLSKTYQTIDGFSASDCWTGNYVGQYWNESPKNIIAKYLFSQNYKTDGSPEGIGLSMWRVNLGAGTLEQGDDSNIDDISRRAECFLDQNGNYNWSKQAGQQWFMQKAKEYGCESFVFFSNSPLVHFTRNGKGYASNDANANIKADKYDDFADYLATVSKHFIDNGYNISHISPVNEPQYDWRAESNGKAGQEGSPWQNSEIKTLVTELDLAIRAKNINTKILIPEAGSWENLYKSRNRAGNQVNEFFNPSHANYVGNLPSVAQTIAAHSYWTETTNSTLKSVRQNVKSNAQNRNVNVYQTEWSLLSETGEGFPGVNSDFSYMDVALYMAKVIHADLAYAEVSSWSFWTSMDMERWDHKNRFLLVSLTPGNNVYAPITQTGTVNDRATLWALGNYSFFIRPGYKRIQLSGADDLSSLMGTAYVSPDGSRIVAVYVNMANEVKKVRTSFQNIEGFIPIKNKVYVTNSSYSLRKYGSTSSEEYLPDREISIPARSVATIVFEMSSNTLTRSTSVSEKMEIIPNPVVAGGKMDISLPNNMQSELSTLIIYAMDGSVVMEESKQIEGNTISIQIPSHIKVGAYLMTVTNSSASLKGKFIITK